MTSPLLSGVLPVLQTPFNADQSVDHTALRREAEWVLDHGANGLVIGMVSEVLRLDDAERIAVTRTLADVAAARGVVLVASVGAESTMHACERARSALAAGATALMATPPLALAAGDEALWHYYLDLAAATELPLVVQDASGYVGRALSIDLQVRLVDALGDRVSLKPEAPPIGARVSQLRDRSAGRAAIIEGSGGIALVDSYRRGVVATMPAADVCWAIVALWQALERNDVAAVEAIHGPLAAMISMQTSLDAYVAIEKHLLVRQGVIPAVTMRAPVELTLDEETAAEVDRLADLLLDACAGIGLTDHVALA